LDYNAMNRSIAAIFLAAGAMALLIMLIVQSRGIPMEQHVAHNAALLELERIAEDHAILIATLEAAWAGRQPAGDSSRVLRERLADAPDRLARQLPRFRAAGSQQDQVQTSLGNLASALAQTAQQASDLATEQDRFAQHLTEVRSGGPLLVQRMRDIRLDGAAADTFALVAGTLEYAAGPALTPPADLRQLIVSLQRDPRVDANMPADLQNLRRGIEQLFTSKPQIHNGLQQLAAIPVPQRTAAFRQAAQTLYAGAAARTDQARTVLSVYAVLLLTAAAIAGWRLHQSYREINQANGDLAELNDTLEGRVADRTRELEDALRNLQESQVQLVQAEKMSSLGQLVAGISHEINTPLLYLANNAELIQERLDQVSDFVNRCERTLNIRREQFADRSQYQGQFVAELKALKKYLQGEDLVASMEEAGQLSRDSMEGLAQLTEIAQSLKDFSRLDRAPVASFDINAGLEKTLLIANNVIKHKATVHRNFGDLPLVQCAPSQINQVFLNLVTNAAQAIEDQGEIVITTSLHGPDHVAIAIADTGCGIPEENLQRIRDPFFTTKEVGSGTGLGLSIVDEIIRNHHGRLLIDSEPGKGSVFTVILPVAGAGIGAAEREQLQETDVDLLLDENHASAPLSAAG
jgi:two-component system, NtrC family, sensor kinase